MQTPTHILGRNMRLLLLLLMLASQGFAATHELSANHSLDAHTCTICVVGHALGTAISADAAVPQVQPGRIWIVAAEAGDLPVSHDTPYRTRAPPASL